MGDQYFRKGWKPTCSQETTQLEDQCVGIRWNLLAEWNITKQILYLDSMVAQVGQTKQWLLRSEVMFSAL